MKAVLVILPKDQEIVVPPSAIAISEPILREDLTSTASIELLVRCMTRAIYRHFTQRPAR